MEDLDVKVGTKVVDDTVVSQIKGVKMIMYNPGWDLTSCTERERKVSWYFCSLVSVGINDVFGSPFFFSSLVQSTKSRMVLF